MSEHDVYVIFAIIIIIALFSSIFYQTYLHTIKKLPPATISLRSGSIFLDDIKLETMISILEQRKTECNYEQLKKEIENLKEIISLFEDYMEEYKNV